MKFEKIASTLLFSLLILIFASGCSTTTGGSYVSPAQMGFFAGAPDQDMDRIPDAWDICPDTPIAENVNRHGCPEDDDFDGVSNLVDKCPGTPVGMSIDKRGCPIEKAEPVVVMDMVEEKMEETMMEPMVEAVPEPMSQMEMTVDLDGDGIPENLDACPDTPKHAAVNNVGCWTIANPTFGFDRIEIREAARKQLDAVIEVMRENPDLGMLIAGHADAQGVAIYNLDLSQRRARAVRDYFAKAGIEKTRLTYEGHGESDPIGDNATREGRAMNRRVELFPVKN